MFGLSDKDIEIIRSIIQKYPEVKEAIIFGSRAKGTQKKGSDIDIALKGKNIDKVKSKIWGELEDETPLPYFFDIANYHTITNQDLIDHIDRVGKSVL